MNDLYSVSEVKMTYETKVKEKVKVNTSMKIYKLMLQNWEQIEYRETFKILLLDRATQALGINTVSLGGISEAIVDLRMIFQVALLANASSLVCVHNHPSGNVQPSIEDDLMTFKILAASKVMDIELVDHLIISDYKYYSYADCGRFN